MDPGNNVVKSKSSNSAIATKGPTKSPARQGSRNKKSWSSAEFHGTSSKKRGVYVEKKSGNSFNTQKAQEDELKVPRLSRRTRRQPKPFLNSVLNILSQDTTATQYPDTSDDIKATRSRKIRRRIGVITVDKGTQDLDAHNYSNNTSPIRQQSPNSTRITRKQKYRSRVLNDNVDDRFVVLKPKRELSHTPSNYSETANAVARDDARKRSDFRDLENHETDRNATKPIQNDDRDVNKIKKAKVLRIEEPSTLVSQEKESKNIYNFFIDLLETTISAYNIHAYNDDTTAASNKSQNKMVIDDSIVKRLQMPEKIRDSSPPVFSDEDFKRNKPYHLIDDDKSTDKVEVYKVKPNYANMNPPILKRPRKRSPVNNLRSSSYTYSQLYRTESPVTQSLGMPKKSAGKKKKKQTLLNILKEQLQMEDDAFEEPQTLHQALKIIAKNKTRCRRAIHFEEPYPANRTSSPDSYQECMFKRRKIISSSTKSTKKNKKFRIYNPQTIFMDSIETSKLPKKFSATTYSSTAYRARNNTPSFSSGVKKKDYCSPDEDGASYHSIEVEAYDFEPNDTLRRVDFKYKPIVYASKTKFVDSGKTSKDSLRTESIESTRNFCDTQGLSSGLSSLSTSISELLIKDTLDMY